MTRIGTYVAAILVMGALQLPLATRAWAVSLFYHSDRPDLVDITDGVTTAAGSLVQFYASHNTSGFGVGIGGDMPQNVAASGVRSGATAGNNKVGYFHWFLYEPDKVTRKTDGAKLKQKDYVGFLVAHTGTTTFTVSGFVPGCKAQASAKATVGTHIDQAKWSIKCAGPILDSLGLTAGQKIKLEEVFGSEILTLKNVGGAYP